MTTPEKARRLLEAAVVALRAAPRRELSAVQLNKALFYADLHALRDLGRSITGNTYIALDAGPVVAKYEERLFRPLVESGRVSVTKEGHERPVRLKSDAPIEVLSEAEQTIEAKVSEWIAKMKPAQASRLSHKNPGWQAADAEFRRTGFRKPIAMTIALLQVVDRDPWLDEAAPAEDVDRAIAALARAGEPW